MKFATQQQILRDCRLSASDCLSVSNSLKQFVPFLQEKVLDSGVVLGIEADTNNLLLETQGRNVLVEGGECAGKGVNTVIPTCLNYQGNLFVFDATGTAYRLTSNYRKKILGQTVLALSTNSERYGEPLNLPSPHWNPFAEIRLGTLHEASDIAAFAQAILHASRDSEVLAASANVQPVLEQYIFRLLHANEAHETLTFCHLASLFETLPHQTTEIAILKQAILPYLDNTVDAWMRTSEISLQEFAQQKGITIYLIGGPRYFSQHDEFARLFYFLLCHRCREAKQEGTAVSLPLFLLDDSGYLWGYLERVNSCAAFMQSVLSSVPTIYICYSLPKPWQQNNEVLEQVFPIRLFLRGGTLYDENVLQYISEKMQSTVASVWESCQSLLFVEQQPPILIKKLRYYEYLFWYRRVLPVCGNP